MDDEPIWAVDRVVASTPGSAITIPEIVNKFAIKVIRVKQKQLNLRVGTERMIFNINFAIRHSYSNDDTCISIDVIEEILEEDFDALLDEDSEILYSIKGTIPEEKLFAEFDEFMAMTADENSESESDTEEPPFEKITFNTDYIIKTSLEEPPTNFELKPLLDNLEYAFLEEPSFLPVIMSSQLSKQKNKLVSFIKRHKIRQSIHGRFLHLWKLFDNCLNSLDKMLQRCKDAHLVLNREKCHFMVKEEIVLGHKILLLQEFDIEIKDRKGTKNVAADHLSRIENNEISDDSEVDYNFPGETLMKIDTRNKPWFADFANYFAPYLFKVCSDDMIRRCVSGPETQSILDQCHHRSTGGHYGPNITAKKS
nr:reverse transcriptase domain-containing protein [Tanacetum cinerariifolium]